jgi:hypothetical protein
MDIKERLLALEVVIAAEEAADRLRYGYPGIEPHIRPLVVALRFHDLPTSGSCEGHVEKNSLPWVGFCALHVFQKIARTQARHHIDTLRQFIEAFSESPYAPNTVQSKEVVLVVGKQFFARTIDHITDEWVYGSGFRLECRDHLGPKTIEERLHIHREVLASFAAYLLQ